MRFVQIQTTSFCNARCKICPYKDDSWMLQNPGIMSDDLFEKIISELHNWEDEINRGKICPYLMNDPFTDKNILDKVEYIRNELPNALIEISTNAELLTKPKSERLYDILYDTKHEIWISRHGITPEDIKKNMQIDGDKSLKNILDLLEVSDGNLNIKIKGFIYSFDKQIILTKPREFIRYWNDLLDEKSINKRGLTIKAKAFHDRSGNLNIDGWDKPKIVRRIGPNHKFYCPRVDQWLHILWNGDVILCCNDYYHETCFGNVEKQSIEEILESEEYKRLYDQVVGNVETDENFICNKCTMIGG